MTSIGIAASQLLSQLLQKIGLDGSSSFLFSSLLVPFILDNYLEAWNYFNLIKITELLYIIPIAVLAYFYRENIKKKIVLFLEKIGLMKVYLSACIDSDVQIKKFILFKEKNPSFFEKTKELKIGNTKNLINIENEDDDASGGAFCIPEAEGVNSWIDFEFEKKRYKGYYFFSSKIVTKRKIIEGKSGGIDISTDFDVYILNIHLSIGDPKDFIGILEDFNFKQKKMENPRYYIKTKYSWGSSSRLWEVTYLEKFNEKNRDKIYSSLFGKELKSVFRKCCDVSLNPDKYYSLGGARASFLLHGPPGTGKSCIVSRLSDYLNLHIHEIDILALTPDEFASSIREARCFGEIKTCGEYIIHIGEIDILIDQLIQREELVKQDERNLYFPLTTSTSLDKKKENSEDSIKLSSRRKILFSDLLEVLQGAVPYHRMILIATTNRYEDMMNKPNYEERMKALFRDGRMTPVKIDYIGENEIREIVNYYFSRDISLEPFSKYYSYTFKELKISGSNIIKIISDLTTFRDNGDYSFEDFLSALEKLIIEKNVH